MKIIPRRETSTIFVLKILQDKNSFLNRYSFSDCEYAILLSIKIWLFFNDIIYSELKSGDIFHSQSRRGVTTKLFQFWRVIKTEMHNGKDFRLSVRINRCSGINLNTLKNILHTKINIPLLLEATLI